MTTDLLERIYEILTEVRDGLSRHELLPQVRELLSEIGAALSAEGVITEPDRGPQLPW